MDKAIMGATKDIMKHGEHMAPVKSIKLKVKFGEKGHKKREKAIEKARKAHTTPH